MHSGFEQFHALDQDAVNNARGWPPTIHEVQLASLSGADAVRDEALIEGAFARRQYMFLYENVEDLLALDPAPGLLVPADFQRRSFDGYFDKLRLQRRVLQLSC